jgi:hypothetical protein
MEIRDLPESRRMNFPAPIALADQRRDLVERLVPVAAVLAAIVTMLIMWW